jgi:hypothetical protein
MKPSLLFAGLLALASAASLSAAEPADSFAGLKIFDVAGSLPAVLHYDPALTQIINKPISTDEDPALFAGCDGDRGAVLRRGLTPMGDEPRVSF